jgi:hypothetical protein
MLHVTGAALSRTIASGLLLGLGIVLASACERDRDHISLEDLQPLSDHCDVPPPPDGVSTVQVVYSCDEVPVGTWRPLPAATVDTVGFAMGALLEGPTPREEEAGLFSFFSSGTAGMLNSVSVRDGVAYIDFQDFSQVIPNASTSAGSRMLLDQIAGTVFQFDGIREAELSFNGNCEAFWNWLQRDCERLPRDEQ